METRNQCSHPMTPNWCSRDGVNVTIALVTLLAGCSGEPSPGSESGGDALWRIGTDPVVLIGDHDDSPEALFHLTRFVEIVDDERLVVTDWDTNSVRVFNLDGDLLQRFAGEGKGPSEIRFSISGAWIAAPDTIHVVDWRQVKTFLLDGSFQGSRALPEDVWPEVLVGVFNDGSMVFAGRGIRRDPLGHGELTRERLPYQHVSPEGENLGVLTWGFHRITYPPTRQPDRPGPPLPPGVGNAQHSLGPHWNHLIRDDTLFLAQGLRPDVMLLTKEGDVARVIPLPGHELSYEEARDSLRVALERIGNKRRIARLDAAPPLDSVPQVAGMLMDDEGLLWVKRFDPAMDTNELRLRRHSMDPQGGDWWIVDREGDLKGTVSLPDRFIPMDISKTLIAGITVDELEVERVAVYRILGKD